MSEHWVKFKDHPGVTFDVACPSSPEWRAQMLKICRDAKSLLPVVTTMSAPSRARCL